MQDQDWDDLRLILAIARGGSFAAAARTLAVNETTVSRRLDAAETRFGLALFDRLQGRLVPTSAGRDAVRHAERAEREYELLRESLTGAGQRVAGRVRVTAVPLIVNRVLVPALAALLKDHPDLAVELVADQSDLSLLGRETDIALRFARPAKEARVVARRVADVTYAAYVAADVDPAALGWIGYDERVRTVPQAAWVRAAAEGEHLPVVLTADDGETVLTAVAEGLGKSILPCLIADRVEGLRRCGGPDAAWSRELWLLVHPDMRRLARIDRTVDWIVDTLTSAN